MSKAPTAEMVEEFQDTHDAIIAACGVAPKSQRPPYGAMTKPQRALLKEKFGYPCILWDVDPLDWKKPGSSVVASRILSGTRNGSIILLHDIHAGSVEAVPAVLDGLLAKGFTFVTVSQLLAMSGQ
jgi:peptidoglycan/xylan/chitin deacetylase (PgdA/CDA1 family)